MNKESTLKSFICTEICYILRTQSHVIILENLRPESMRQSLLTFLLLLPFALSAQSVYECISIENDLEYIFLESLPSKTSVDGLVEGGRVTHSYRCSRLGFIDRVYAGYGTLTGEDVFDDDVSIDYTEFDGELWFTYLFLGKSYAVTPFIGWGYRQHQNKKTKPMKLYLETTYVYLPVGLKINSTLTRFVEIGAYAKADILTYTWWKYHHPLFCEKSRELQNCPAYEASVWMSYMLAAPIRATLAGSFRYLELLYPEDVTFAPEHKKQLNYGFRASLDYHY